MGSRWAPRAKLRRLARRAAERAATGIAGAFSVNSLAGSSAEEAASSSAAAPNRFVAFAMPSWVERRMEATRAALREEAAAAKTAEKAALKAQKAALRAAVSC